MRQIRGRFVGTTHAVGLRHRRAAEAGELREDVPDPVRALGARPEFGERLHEGARPVLRVKEAIEIVDPAGPRDRLTVAIRLILAIPHFIVLFFVLLGWCVTTIVAWFVIVLTGDYPQGLWAFGVGALRWLLRLQAYLLLLVDEYPPFSLDA